MKHSISIEPGSSYRRILDIIQSEDGTAQSESLTDEHDGTNPYQLLTVISDKAISERTEAKIDAQQNVIVATFNIDERDAACLPLEGAGMRRLNVGT